VGLGDVVAVISMAALVAVMILVSVATFGGLFFASDQELIDAFDFAGDPPRVIVDLSRAHVWDASAVAALDAIETHYARHGVQVEITGLNARSEALHRTLSGQLAGAH
jgi:SulP family sulfate permease